MKTNNPSTIGSDELLTVHFPDLKENQVIVPGTTKLTFNISLSGTDANKTLVKSSGRNVIRKLVAKLKGNEIISINDCDIFDSRIVRRTVCESMPSRVQKLLQWVVALENQHAIRAVCKGTPTISY